MSRMLIEINPDNIGKYVSQLVAIEQASFSSPWTTEDYLTEAARPIAHILAVVEGEELLGYAGFWQVLDEAEVNNVAIAPPHRGKGLGRVLMAGLLDMARLLGCQRVNLEVRAGNHAALGLYQSLGFSQVGCRGGYYSDPVEDAILMTCVL